MPPLQQYNFYSKQGKDITDLYFPRTVPSRSEINDQYSALRSALTSDTRKDKTHCRAHFIAFSARSIPRLLTLMKKIMGIIAITVRKNQKIQVKQDLAANIWDKP